MSESHKGIPRPESVIIALRKRVLTDKQKALLTRNQVGHEVTEETRAKLRAAFTGRPGVPRTPEWKAKIAAAISGEKSPNWKGGISFEPYCPKFNKEFRERVRAFFNYTCQVCGRVWQPGERRLAVHHVNYQKKACCDQLVIPLFVPVCPRSCHSITGHHREEWEAIFIKLITEKFNGRCYFTVEEMQAAKTLLDETGSRYIFKKDLQPYLQIAGVH